MIFLIVCYLTYASLLLALLTIIQIVHYRRTGKIIGYRTGLDRNSHKSIKQSMNNIALTKALVMLLLTAVLITVEAIYVLNEGNSDLKSLFWGGLLIFTIVSLAVQFKLRERATRTGEDDNWIV